MRLCDMTLPEYHMVAGESKSITIPIYNRKGKQIDATGMTARFAINSFVTPNMAPLTFRDCEVVKDGSVLAALRVNLLPEDTAELRGKFLYQITAKDMEDNIGVMQGYLFIHMNGDRDAISI